MPASAARKAARKRKFAHLHQGDAALEDPPEPSKRARSSKKPGTNGSAPAPTDEDGAPARDELEGNAAAAAEDGNDAADAAGDDAAPDAEGEGVEGEGADGEADPAHAAKKHRFILFVGNLPWEASAAGLAAHFAAVRPAAIRHRTDRKTGQSRGFAFLEFDRYDRMEECLQRFHHSIYEEPGADGATEGGENGRDGRDAADADGAAQEKPKETSRRINVELTAGGGGTGAERKERLEAKNAKLRLERKKRQAERKQAKAQEERKAAKEKRRVAKAAKEAKAAAREAAQHGPAAGGGGSGGIGADDFAGIHPSRRANMRG